MFFLLIATGNCWINGDFGMSGDLLTSTYMLSHTLFLYCRASLDIEHKKLDSSHRPSQQSHLICSYCNKSVGTRPGELLHCGNEFCVQFVLGLVTIKFFSNWLTIDNHCSFLPKRYIGHLMYLYEAAYLQSVCFNYSNRTVRLQSNFELYIY